MKDDFYGRSEMEDEIPRTMSHNDATQREFDALITKKIVAAFTDLRELADRHLLEHVCACGHKFWGPPEATKCLACEYP